MSSRSGEQRVDAPQSDAGNPQLTTAVSSFVLTSLCFWCLCFFAPPLEKLRAQVESVESPTAPVVWVNDGRLEGHLALNYSPDGAFSPDGSTLAFPSESKIVLLNLAQNRPEKVLKI